ncbi:hypothetical protein N7493_007351 [Penicillium malachiteum]|uniref:Uncharacterized protein n=1 Tax=Penicillium malachiteum TaxID=1324776 RepID=A0AAD6HJX0_9EURO|nr:hypothetical protein N7493_007351 [Penicillium malachiteum]
MAELPSWGQKVDAQVQQYIAALQRVPQANLYWSFISRRYFGSELEKIRESMTVHLCPRQADLAEAR